nr:RNA polymerase sigma-70 factor [uncultured Arsenicibacter sp.]
MLSKLNPDQPSEKWSTRIVPMHPADELAQADDDGEFFIRQAFMHNPRQACELLFRQYYGPLCSHAVRFVQNREVAEDLVSDVFYAFWVKEIYLNVTTSFRAYLFYAVRNRAYNYIRWELNRQEPMPDDLDRPEAEAAQPDRLMQQDELQVALDEAMRQLTPQQQRIFLMSRFEGKKYKEIAAELNLAPKTVENHLLRAIATLRTILTQKNVLFLALLANWIGEN